MPAPKRPFQFRLSTLLQLVAVVALWCGAGMVRNNYVLGVVYVIVTAIATWVTVGQWAVTLPPNACRRVLAGLAALMAVGASGLATLIMGWGIIPLVFFGTSIPVSVLFEGLQLWRFINSLQINWPCYAAVVAAMVYFFTSGAFRIWDEFGARSNQRHLAVAVATLLTILAIPLALSGGSGLYELATVEFPITIATRLWLIVGVHAAMLAAAAAIVVLVARHASRSTATPPNWLKLLAWGYMSLYCVLSYVALFPIDFYAE